MTETLRNEHTILADSHAAKLAYIELMNNDERTVKQEKDAAQQIKDLQTELDKYLTEGAVACERCGNIPMGMLKTPAYENNGVPVPAVFEVGCVYCPPFLVEREDGKALVLPDAEEPVKVKRRSYSARGTSAEEARTRWNEQQYVEDFFFDRIPGFTPVYADDDTTA